MEPKKLSIHLGENYMFIEQYYNPFIVELDKNCL